MALVLPPVPNSPVSNSFEWREWFYALYSKFASGGSGVSFTSLDFSNSNIDSIVIRDHNTLTNIQGGDSLNRYHLTSAQYATVVSLPTLGTMATQNANSVAITGGSITGITFPYTSITGLSTVAHTGAYSDLSGLPTGLSVTITTAKLTSGGANGSMTFTNGILTAQTQAT